MKLLKAPGNIKDIGLVTARNFILQLNATHNVTKNKDFRFRKLHNKELAVLRYSSGLVPNVTADTLLQFYRN
jgi:hypothetical protein